jgi:hypothetical protein
MTKQMGIRAGKFLFMVESQLVKVHGMMKLENHYLITTITITDSGKKQQRMQKSWLEV